MKIKKLNMSERPREKMMVQGRESLSNSELLAILLKTGSKKEGALALSTRILNHEEGGLSRFAEYSIEELTAFDGIGQVKACEIHAAMELGIRISKANAVSLGRITDAEGVAKFFMDEMKTLKKEVFKILLLDLKGKIITWETISVGNLTTSLVHPRETFRSAVKRSAASIILVHNHPSGDPTPSEDDKLVTRRLVEAGNILGVPVLDHIVIGDSTFVSLKEEGLM